jgi:DNA-binding Lrp family transcriptional regulator
MPGGRLSYQDRAAIAAGLAEGRSQAEIARRLDRPTSTISREVTRNGGTAGYRADRAQTATGQRARRSRPPAEQPSPAVEDGYGRDPQALQDVEESFLAMLVQSGVPRMMARILTCLYLTDTGSMTAADLVRRLHVSPASVSKAVGFLEQHGLIRRDHVGTGRRERYTVDDDIWFRSWQASARQNEDLANAAQRAAEVLGPDTPAGARLQFMGDFLSAIRADMLKAAEHWLSELRARRLAAGGAAASDGVTPGGRHPGPEEQPPA